MGGTGDPARSGRRPADRNDEGEPHEIHHLPVEGVTFPVPSGQWPDGTGGSPVPPIPRIFTVKWNYSCASDAQTISWSFLTYTLRLANAGCDQTTARRAS